MSDLEIRLQTLRSEINDACVNSGRSPDDVSLLAISKTHHVDQVAQVAKLGQMHFGENYLQDALSKVTVLNDVVWHFVGAIQSNKTRDIAKHFDWVHSVASAKIARRLNDQRDPSADPINILFQVNQSAEDSKSGITPDQISDLIDETRGLANIRLRGLMTIPEAGASDGLLRQRFADLREHLETNRRQFDLETFDQLSMGMSKDFGLAIAEGATWIRIGTAIFGPRNG